MSQAYLRLSTKTNSEMGPRMEKINKISLIRSNSNLNEYNNKTTTFEKICTLQSLLKEVTSMKERFENNKEKMEIQIKKNCYNYYKSKISIQEIYDYVLKKKYINYILSEDIQSDLSSSYEFIFPLMFSFRNSNKKILDLIEKCPKENYDYLSNFLVNYFYENILNPSFCQDDFIVLIYLLFEKTIEKNVPLTLLGNDNPAYAKFLDNTFLNYLFNYFTRKEDIRNYLCVILSDLILDIENSIIGTLSPQIYKINEFLIEKKGELKKLKNYENNRKSSFHENQFKESATITYDINNLISDSNLTFNQNVDENYSSIHTRVNTLVSENISFNINEDEKEQNSDIIETKNQLIDAFFKPKDITLNYLKNKLSEYEKKIENKENDIEVNLLMSDYLNRQISLLTTNNEIIEKFSNERFLEEINILSTNKSPKMYNDITNLLMLNFENTKRIIEKLLNNLLLNITTIPYSLKCICKIISNLISYKFSKIKIQPSNFEKLMFVSTFFLGNIIYPTIVNPDFCGIITSNVISEKTKNNLNVISKIINQIVSGNLFSNDIPSYTIFNYLIIDLMPKFFELFLKIGNNVILPSNIELLFNSYKEENNNEIKNPNIRNIDVNYTENQTDMILYQSICFDRRIILIFIDIIKKNQNFFESEYPDLITLFKSIILIEEFFQSLLIEDEKNKKVTFNYISKIIYNREFESKINKITSNNYTIFNNEKDKSEISKFKKCCCEVLSYVNILHKENFSNTDKLSFYNQLLERKNQINSLKKKNRENSTLENIDINLENKENNIIQKEDFDFANVILPQIITTLKYELGFNIHTEEAKKITFCATFLQLNLDSIPSDYSFNNYNKLFIELIYETESSIEDLQVNLINHFYLKVKNAEKLNMIVNSTLYQIKQMEKCYNIKNLYHTLVCPVKLITVYDEKTKELIKVSVEQDSSQNALKKINSFIENFPDFRNEKNKNQNNDDDDIITFEEKLEINEVLNTYFGYLKKLLKNEPIMSKYTNEEFINMNFELDNYILSKLYNKLFPEEQTKKDIKFYNKCLRLDFLKPENIIKDKKMINEKLWISAMKNINEMDNQKTPIDKIKYFNKAFGILQNSITFCSGKDELGVDDSITILQYVFLKAKPKMMISNMNYSMLFIDSELSKKQYGMLLTQINMIVTIIENLKYSDLINVSEDDFGKDD